MADCVSLFVDGPNLYGGRSAPSARPSRVGARLACGGLRPPRPHPGGASAARRSGPPTRPGFSLLWGAQPPTPPSGPVPAARIRGQPRVLSGGGCGPHAPRRSGARGADSRAARVLSRGGCGPHAPRRSGARGADSRAAARSVWGRLRPSRSPPVRCPRRGFEGSARSVPGRLRPSRSPPVRRPRRGFEGSRAFCPGEAAPLTLLAGPVPAARVQGEPGPLSRLGSGQR